MQANAALRARPQSARGLHNLTRSNAANPEAGVGDTGLGASDETQVRIIGGEISDPGEFPYYVDLDGCGGTLIAPRVVLTACKCFVLLS